MQLGDLERAKEYHNRAREINLKKRGNDSINTANTFVHLGSIHKSMGELESAKTYVSLALDVATTYGLLGDDIHEKFEATLSAQRSVRILLLPLS